MLQRTLVFALLSLLSVSVVGRAQTVPTQQELEARLKSQFLMLRGTWDGNKLAFDDQGNLLGTAQKTFFSLSAVVVDNILLSDTQLQIHGRRAGLTFQYKGPYRPQPTYITDLETIKGKPYGRDDVTVTIARNPLHLEGLEDAVSRIFSIGIDEQLVAEAPFYWQSLLRQYLHPDQKEPPPPAADQIIQIGKEVRNPFLKYAPDPPYSTVAKKLKMTGVSVIRLIVDENGMPRRVRIVRPLGMGLDECAVGTVAQYHFTPALYQGRPVRVEINIEVNFRIY